MQLIMMYDMKSYTRDELEFRYKQNFYLFHNVINHARWKLSACHIYPISYMAFKYFIDKSIVIVLNRSQNIKYTLFRSINSMH